MNNMRIGIVACEILKREIEMITANDPEVVYREYLGWGLHDFPDRLNQAVVEKVNSLVGKVDVVFLGYAICRSLGNVPSALEVPTIMLREDDCIGSMLGQEEYAKERSGCPGTWFSTPGWSALGMDGIVKDDQMVGLKEQGYDKLYFAKAQLSGYSRCLFIDTGVGDRERYRSLTEELANQLDLRCEHREANLKALKEAWLKVKTHSPQEMRRIL
jgi:hypothetical protein